MQTQLRTIESTMLKTLNESEGNPVDNQTLIDTLSIAKSQSEEIERKVSAAKITETNIDTTRRLYEPVAKNAQILFFTLQQISKLDITYQYSVEWFSNLFLKSLNQSPKSCN